MNKSLLPAGDLTKPAATDEEAINRIGNCFALAGEGIGVQDWQRVKKLLEAKSSTPQITEQQLQALPHAAYGTLAGWTGHYAPVQSVLALLRSATEEFPPATHPGKHAIEESRKYRREGRAEALQLLVSAEAETFGDEYTYDQRGIDDSSVAWDIEKLQGLLDVGDEESMVDRLDACYWQHEGEIEELKRELANAREVEAFIHPMVANVENLVNVYEQRPFNVAHPLTRQQEIENAAIMMAHALAAWKAPSSEKAPMAGKAPASTIEDKAFSVLEAYGVPRERAKNVPNGIQVLVSRMDKEIAALRHERNVLQKICAERSDEIERLSALPNALQNRPERPSTEAMPPLEAPSNAESKLGRAGSSATRPPEPLGSAPSNALVAQSLEQPEINRQAEGSRSSECIPSHVAQGPTICRCNGGSWSEKCIWPKCGLDPATGVASAPSTIAPSEPPMVYDPQHGAMVRPGGVRALMNELRQLFDKTAEARDGDYADKVSHALVAVYAYGRRQTTASATPQKSGWAIQHVDGRWRTMDTIGMPDWTDDPAKALVCRLREHTDAYATDDPEDVRIVEVSW